MYQFLLTHPLAHDGSHVLLLAIGYLYWQALIGGDPTRRRLSHRARMISAFSGATAECALAMAIMNMHRPSDPINSVSDTHRAEVALLISALATCALCCRVMAHRSRAIRATVQHRPPTYTGAVTQ